MKFLIPSYHRPERQYTVRYLNRIGVSPEDIHVSVQNQEDYEAYSVNLKGLAQLMYKESSGVAANRNQLLDTLEPGEKAVMMDDNIRCMKRYSPIRSTDSKYGTLREITSTKEFLHEINCGFRLCARYNACLWGVSAYSNIIFRHGTVIRNGMAELNVEFLACIMGIIKTDIRFDETLRINEDLDFIARHIMRGLNVVRLNSLQFAKRTDKKHDKGGCHDDHEAYDEIARQIIMDRYPGLFVTGATGKEIKVNKNLRGG